MKQVESASASASASESASESESEIPPLVKSVYPSTVSKCGEVERWTGVQLYSPRNVLIQTHSLYQTLRQRQHLIMGLQMR